MNWERLDSFVLALLASVGSGVLWLIRKVVTSEKQIALLIAEIAQRDKLRQEDREAVKEVREEVKGLRADFHEFTMRIK